MPPPKNDEVTNITPAMESESVLCLTSPVFLWTATSPSTMRSSSVRVTLLRGDVGTNATVWNGAEETLQDGSHLYSTQQETAPE